MQDCAQRASPKAPKPLAIGRVRRTSLRNEIAQLRLDQTSSSLPHVQRYEECERLFVANNTPMLDQHLVEWARKQCTRKMKLLESQMWKANPVPAIVEPDKAGLPQSFPKVAVGTCLQ